jgi:precorrin-3B synthase
MTAQGWCPSTHRLHDAPDGWLARVKVPGGRVGLEQLRAVATAASRLGNGTVEITSRANLQIRGVDLPRAAELRLLLAPVGLSSPTAEIEDRRNVLASPTAGLTDDELLDVRPVADAVVASLDALPPLVRLPHKFGVLLDGGGSPTLRGRAVDVALGAVVVPGGIEGRGRVFFELALGAGLPLASEVATVFGPVAVVEVDDAPALVAAAARLCAGEVDGVPADRMSEIVGCIGIPATLDALSRFLEGTRTYTVTQRSKNPDGGTWPIRWIEVASRPGLDAERVGALADVLAGYGLDEVRLTPWRSVVVPVRGAVDADRLVADLDAAGWVGADTAGRVGAPA